MGVGVEWMSRKELANYKMEGDVGVSVDDGRAGITFIWSIMK